MGSRITTVWLCLLVAACASRTPPAQPTAPAAAPKPAPRAEPLQPPRPQPVEEEQEEVFDDYDFDIEGGVVGGISGGAVGGAPGGIPGGVVGGMLGPMPNDMDDEWGVVDKAEGREVAGEVIEQHRRRGEPILPPPPIRDRITRSKRGHANATVEVCLSATGEITTTRIVTPSGYPEYDHALLEGLWSWEFGPVSVDGEPLAVCGSIDLRYPEDD